MGRKLTEDNLEDLRKDYGVLTTKEITEKYQCSYSTIERFCKSHGFKSKRANGRSSAKKYPYPYEHLEEFLQDWKDNILTLKELEEKYASTTTALYSIAKLYNVFRGDRIGSYKITQKQEEQLIADYKNGVLSYKEIADKYNISQSIIPQILKRNHIITDGPTKRNRIYCFNEHYLDIVDSEEKAYFLGFVYADGGHNESRHALTITLQNNDSDLLKRFYKMFECDRQINFIHNKQYDRYYAQFRLQSTYFSQQLLKLGVPKDKSFKITFPTFLPSDLTRHFIRGYFDGDGCIGLSNRGWKSTSVKFVGNEHFLKDVKKIIDMHTNKDIKLYQKTNSQVYELSSAGIFNVYVILNYLYKDATIYLQRKYDRYIDFITKYEKEYLNNERN